MLEEEAVSVCEGGKKWWPAGSLSIQRDPQHLPVKQFVSIVRLLHIHLERVASAGGLCCCLPAWFVKVLLSVLRSASRGTLQVGKQPAWITLHKPPASRYWLCAFSSPYLVQQLLVFTDLTADWEVLSFAGLTRQELQVLRQGTGEGISHSYLQSQRGSLVQASCTSTKAKIKAQ